MAHFMQVKSILHDLDASQNCPTIRLAEPLDNRDFAATVRDMTDSEPRAVRRKAS